MAPIGSRQAACVSRTAAVFAARVAGRAIVSVQNPIELDERSEPQPDVALLRARADFYEGSHPQPADVLLAVEVAETTLGYDLSRKAPYYLARGIPEVWVVGVVRR